MEMTVTIPIRVAGEIWFNATEVKQILSTLTAQDQIILDLCSEAPCLNSIGLSQILNAWLAQHEVDPSAVQITRWANTVQQVPYTKVTCMNISQFFRYSKQYWLESVSFSTAEKLFGLFLGRNSISRNTILYEVNDKWPQHFLCSRMKARAPEPWLVNWDQDVISLESIDQWNTPEQLQKIIAWYKSDPVPSLDGKEVRDQYQIEDQSTTECNRSLLEHYDRFNIELVCETYAYGDTFFPTEKTVRPIMAAKPFLVYGPQGYLRRLRDLGFRTYADCWDESYDLLEGPQRWLAMKSVIQNVIDRDPLDTLSGAWDISLHNRQHLQHEVSNRW
jgi:hypothetical protein